jgi:hypothetical protein
MQYTTLSLQKRWVKVLFSHLSIMHWAEAKYDPLKWPCEIQRAYVLPFAPLSAFLILLLYFANKR